MTVCSSGSRMTASAACRSRRAWRSPLMSAERCPHRLVEAERMVVEPCRRRLLDHHLALETVDERAHEARLDGGDERDPVGGEAGREHGHLDDERRPAAEDP